MLKYLNRLAKEVDKKRKNELLRKLHQALLALSDDPAEYVIFNFFPFLQWVEAQLSNKTIKEVISEQ